jgi:signal transduction histidine kinase
MLKVVQTSSKMLFLQVNDLLDRALIRKQHFRVNITEFNLSKAINEVIQIELANAELRKNEITLKIDKNMPKCVNTDLNRFQQVFLNLLSNANKFTRKGKIKVLCSLTDFPDGGDR